MKESQPASRRGPMACLGLISIACVLGLAACGDDGLGRRYSVTGTVTYKGTPVEKGTISFVPVNADGRAATGTIEKGSYTLTTLSDRDGALPGDYKVAISSRVADMSKAEANAQKTGGVYRQDDVSKAYKAAKGATPAKYEVAETSGQTAKVEAKSNKINFDLPE